jgi:XRE family aerobic/anaerobic benzoate catabolism transcriptional regulator
VRDILRIVDPASSLLTALGQRARELRTAQQLTLRALADRSGLSARFLMDVESGRANISVRRLAHLAAALKTTPAELVSTVSGTAAIKPIALLGLRGSGKTTIGKRLARRLRVPFVELDQKIEERAGLRLSEIFSLHGEDFYRRLERESLDALLAGPATVVIAVGGGLVTSSDSFALLRQHATTVWLRARADDYWDRVAQQGDRRPMNEHPQAREALHELVSRREPLYAKADFTVDTSGVSVTEVVDRAAALLVP